MEALKVYNDLNCLSVIRDYVKTAAMSVNLNKKTSDRLVVAVGEIIENLVDKSPSDMLHLQAIFYGQGLSILIEYDGIPYNPYDSFDWLNISLVVNGIGHFIHQWIESRNQIICSTRDWYQPCPSK